jgi:hypothetical protein
MNFKKSFLLIATFCCCINSYSSHNWPQTIADAVAEICRGATLGMGALFFERFLNHIGQHIDYKSSDGEHSMACAIAGWSGAFVDVETGKALLWGIELLNVKSPWRIFLLEHFRKITITAGSFALIICFLKARKYKYTVRGLSNFAQDMFDLSGMILYSKGGEKPDFTLCAAIPLASVGFRNLPLGAIIATFSAAYPLFKKILLNRLGFVGALIAAFNAAGAAGCITWCVKKYSR